MSKRCMYFEQLTAWYSDIMVNKESKIHARNFYMILHDIEYLQTRGGYFRPDCLCNNNYFLQIILGKINNG